MSIQEAITAVMKDVGAVGKDDVNQAQRFTFRGVDATVNALSPIMRKHGVTVRPSEIVKCDYTNFVSKSGAQGTACKIIVEYTFRGPEGDEVSSVVAAEANDYGDKATPKAMSVAFRTCLLQTFALPTQETDPDAETYDQRPARDWESESRATVTAGGAPDVVKGRLRALWQEAQAAGDVPGMDAVKRVQQEAFS